MTYENIEVKVAKHFFGFVDTFSDVFFFFKYSLMIV